MDLTTFRTVVKDRLGLQADDRWSSDTSLTYAINQALHTFETAQQSGWPWLRTVVSFPTVAGTASYGFATISGGAFDIAKIVELRISVPASQFMDPLMVVSKADLLGYYGDQTTRTPEAIAVDGQAVWFGPIPDGAYTVVGTVIRTEPDLAAGGDVPITPTIFHGAIVEKAAELIARRLAHASLASSCHQGYVELLTQARGYARETVGHGRVRDTFDIYAGGM